MLTPQINSQIKTGLRREFESLHGCFHLRLTIAQALVGCLPEFALVSVRATLYRWAGIKIARGVTVQGRLWLVGRRKDLSRIQVGEGCILAPGVRIGLDAPVVIGKNVALGPDVTLCTATHTIGFGSRRMTPTLNALPVTVGDGAWICMSALLLPGVTVGPGAVVAAGSIVTEDVSAHTLVAGNPAQVQHELPFANR
ncbi:acyltransferase [Armatimonas sp.]|uniref:acyltransferase n=1 Tax=Armatimonas sp. TaxID=1872638 RepID=UPI00375282BA